LFGHVIINVDANRFFVYSVDFSKTIAVRGNVLSNFTIDYGRIVNDAFNDIVEENVRGAEDQYASNAKVIAEAVHVLRDRTIVAIYESSLADTEKKRLVSYFHGMLERPAEHFAEGLQRILFFNQVLWQTRHRLNGFGCLDRVLGTLYEKDLSAGIITEDKAAMMVDEFLTSLSLPEYYEKKSDALVGDIGQIIVLGGLEPDGSYFCNEVTYLFLEAQAKLRKPDPKTFLRVSKNMPQGLLTVATECLKSATGSPLFSNDDVVIPALVGSGVPRRDACTYAVSACWEPLIPGKSLGQNNIEVFNYSKPFVAMLNKERLSGVTTFDSLVDLYKAYLGEAATEFFEGLDEFKWAEDPFVSLLTDGCAKNRCDVSRGGACYNNYGVTTVGMGNVIDSLYVIDQLVFHDGLSLEEMNKARQNNFKNNEELYAHIKALPHRYAHDDPKVSDLVNELSNILDERARSYTNPLGGSVKFGLSSPAYIMLSRNAPADFSGRKNGSPYTVHISNDDTVLTEVVNFASKLDYGGQRYNGNVIDQFIAPTLLDEHKAIFDQFMAGAIETGFYQLQFNVMDSNTLIDARAHPDKYPGLIVRVWGFSAYFNDLPDEYKDVLINRAMENEKRAA
jgi:formate C-acetyltransferase